MQPPPRPPADRSASTGPTPSPNAPGYGGTSQGGAPPLVAPPTPHPRALPIGDPRSAGQAAYPQGATSPYLQPTAPTGGGLRAALGLGLVALLFAFWAVDPLELQAEGDDPSEGTALAEAKQAEQARRGRVFKLKGGNANDLAAALEILAPTPKLQPDKRFVSALRWLSEARGTSGASVEVRTVGRDHEVLVDGTRLGTWSRVPSAEALWSVIDAHAAAVAAEMTWTGDAPSESNWREVSDSSKALAVADETAKAWASGKRTRAVAARHATALVALVMSSPEDLQASDDLAASAIGAVALAAAAGAPMEGQRAVLELALGYTVRAAARELPADLPEGLRLAITTAGQRRDVTSTVGATALERSALLRRSPGDADVPGYEAIVDDTVKRAPLDLGASSLQLHATWAPVHLAPHFARIEHACAGAPAPTGGEVGDERLDDLPDHITKLLAGLPADSTRAFDADDVRGAFCRNHVHDTIDVMVRYVVDVQGVPGADRFPHVFTSSRAEDAAFLTSLQIAVEAKHATGLTPELSQRALARDDLLPRAWQALLPLSMRKGRFADEVTVISDRVTASLDTRPTRREALAKHLASFGERGDADMVLASVLDESDTSVPYAATKALSAREDVDRLFSWALDEKAATWARNAAIDELVELSKRDDLKVDRTSLLRAMDLAIEAAPKSTNALVRKADWLHDFGRHEENVTFLQAVIARDAFGDGLARAIAYTKLARAQRSLGRYNEALAAAKQAAESGSAASYDELARALTHVGELAEAKRVHQLRAQRYPIAGADAELARLAWIRGEPEEAVRALLSDPKRAPDLTELARQLDAAFPLQRDANGEPLARGRDANMMPALDAIIAARSPLIDLPSLGTSLTRKGRHEANLHLLFNTPSSGHSKHRQMSHAYTAARRAGFTRADALALVQPHLPPQPDGIAAVVQLADYAYDLPWLDAPDPTKDAGAAHMAWLARAAGEAERGFPDAERRRILEAHYAGPAKDLYDTLGQYILGQATADEVWARVATEDQVTEALFYLGTGAWGRDDPYLAMRYWRACVATQRNRNVEWTAAANRVWSRSFVAPTLPKWVERDRWRETRP